MAREYALGDQQVLDMPIRRFWLMSAAIQRMESLADLRTIRLMMATQAGSDRCQEVIDELQESVGMTAIVEHAFDPDGYEALKLMAG